MLCLLSSTYFGSTTLILIVIEVPLEVPKVAG